MSEIVERFTRIRRDRPSRAIIHVPASGASVSAEALWEEALAQGRALQSLGAGEDDLIISAAGNRSGSVALVLACRRLGAALMPVDAGSSPSELRALAERFGARFAVLQSLPTALAFGGTVHPFPGGLTCAALTGITPAPDLYRGAAALKVTSGSTGLPKATLTRESQLVADTLHIVMAMDIGPEDTQIAVIPLSHAYGIGNLVMATLVQGTPMVLRDAFVPQQVQADAAAYRARSFPGVPFMFAHFASHAATLTWPRHLDHLVSAGAPLDAATARAFARAHGIKVHSFYGASETGGISYDDSPDVDVAGTVGRALPGVTISLHADDGAPSGSGRVHVASEAVSSGYAGPIDDNDGFTGGGFLTGDYGRYDPAGHLVLTGRVSSFINVAGRKVQPEEVEGVLKTMPGVADVRVLGAADPARGQHIAACIVASGTAAISATAVRRFCAARLSASKVPRTVVFVDRIPLTERGKTDRAKLEAQVRDHLDRTAESGVL